LKLLEEIRLLTNIMRNGLPRVRLVLCGSLKLEDNLCHPQMESLNQRIATRCYLTPLSMEETSRYVAHKIELSGVSYSSVITRDALDALYRGSDGIPRLIDRLADQSLLLAAQEKQRPVSAALVGKAWGMLQQLPNPWSEPETIKSPAKSPAFVSQSAAVGQESTIVQPATTGLSVSTEQPLPIGQSVSISTSDSVATTAATANIAAWFQSSTIQPSVPQTSLAYGQESTNVYQDGSAIQYDTVKPTTTSNRANSPSCSESIVEFGTLDDLCEPTPSRESLVDSKPKNFSLFATESSAPKPFAWERDLDEYQLAPISRAETIKPTAAPIVPTQPSIDRKSVFGSDFDEEFNLPVQSSNGYKSYSGVAFGNLNHDLQSFESEQVNRFEIGEADDFLAPAPNQFAELDRRRDEPSIANDMSFEPISNITPSQAANLERQVEEEMRELVSDLNMNAMTFDPIQTIVDAPSNTPAPMLLERFGERDVLSFAEMNHQWNPNERRERNVRTVTNAGDDRDMLVVEDDLETIRDTMGSVQNAPHRPVLHPYAKLFSNLRDS
jgi:hypothetical protein